MNSFKIWSVFARLVLQYLYVLQLKLIFTDQTQLNRDHKYNPPVHVVAGAAAGAAASAFTTPLDVIKTLLNTQETGIGLTKGMREACAQVR